MKRRLFIVILLISASYPAMISGQKQGPVDAVQAFYKFERSRSGVFSMSEILIRRRFFTAELDKLFVNEAKREDAYIRKNPSDKPHFGDGFPFQPYEECVKGNDMYRNDFELAEVSIEKDIAIVEIKFFTPKQCDSKFIDSYQIQLLRTKNKWLINDWIFSDAAKLSDDLKRKDY